MQDNVHITAIHTIRDGLGEKMVDVLNWWVIYTYDKYFSLYLISEECAQT